jgi:hypothetical protein
MRHFREALAALGLLLLCAVPAIAQHDHAGGHDVYSGWRNQDFENCCNGKDCGSLAEVEERWNGQQLEVKVEGEWCPVLPHMRVRNASSPDWSKSHACVWPMASEWPQPVCQRLKCFKGKGGF